MWEYKEDDKTLNYLAQNTIDCILAVGYINKWGTIGFGHFREGRLIATPAVIGRSKGRGEPSGPIEKSVTLATRQTFSRQNQ